MSFAKKIQTLRTSSGLSQEALADQLLVSRQAVSKWESGITLPETEKLIILSEMFGVTVDYLLKEDVRNAGSESLDRVILRFLGSAQDIDGISKELINIIQDGIVDEEEKAKLTAIMDTLDEVTRNIEDIKVKMAETK